MNKALSRWMPRKLLIPGLIVLLAGSSLAIMRQRVDFGSGLGKRGGFVDLFVSSEQGISLILHESGKDAWGFFEWPSKGSYGFFNGSRKEDGEIRANVQSAGPSMVLTVFPGSPARAGESGPARNLRLRLEGEGEPSGDFALKRQKMPDIVLEVREGRLDGATRILSPLLHLFERLSVEDGLQNGNLSFFYVAALGAGTGLLGEFLDTRLRRGLNPDDYSRNHWKAFIDGRKAVSDILRWPSVLVERQYFVSAYPSVYSFATERYVFEGGAHGNTTLLIEMIDAKSGRTLQPDDIFVDGWKEPVAEKLRKEALRLLSGADGKAPASGSLVDRGFFEERIPPSTNVFLCESGVGFHYDRYQLAPYSFGDFTFVLRWKELGGLLKASWLEGKLP
ncbi:MAG TPA: RsiV family protein [Rectinemataceae bacterium]|nr:RsiV family protein [Rectinemataceae bacterium]